MTQRRAQPLSAKRQPGKTPQAPIARLALPNVNVALQSPEGILGLQRAIGNRAVDRLSRRQPSARPTGNAPPASASTSDPATLGQPSAFLAQPAYDPAPRGEPPIIQARLQVGPAGDAYEREADRVVRQVVSRLWSASSPGGHLQNEAETGPVQRAPERSPTVGLAGGPVSASVESRINSARGGGHPLEDGIRSKMESGFGADFSGVRVHTDSLSHTLSQAVQARAFTTGQDVFFRNGAYQPGSSGGQELLAHELTHVVQQTGARAVQRDFSDEQIELFHQKQRRERQQELGGISTIIQDRQAGGNRNERQAREGQEVENPPENGPEEVANEQQEAEVQPKQGSRPKIGADVLEALGQFSGIVSSGGSLLNYFGAQGSDNLGFYDTGSKKTAFSGDFTEHKDAGRSAGGDVVNTVGSVGADALGIATMDKDTAKTFWGKLQKVGMAIRMVGTAIRGGAGASQAKLGLDGSVLKDPSVTGDLSKFGTSGIEGANTATLMKGVGDSVANVGTSAVFVGKAGYQARRGVKFLHRFRKDSGFRKRTAMGHAERGGRFLTVLADLFQGAAAATQGMARSAAWIANMVKGGASTAASAGNVAATAMTVSGIGSAVVGGLQAIAGLIKVGRAGRRRSNLTARLTDKEKPLTAAQNAAFEHVKEVQKKRQGRAAGDIIAGALGVVGGALAATGYGLIPGLVLGGAAAAILIGRFATRKIKQYGRDKKAARIAAIEKKWAGRDEASIANEDEATKADFYSDKAYLAKVSAVASLRERQAAGEKLSMKERLKLAFSFDETKNTSAKNTRNEATIKTIKEMQTEDQELAVKTLGIDIKKWRQQKDQTTEDGENRGDELLKKALVER